MAKDTPLFMDGAWVDVFPWGFNYRFVPLDQTAARWGNHERVMLPRHGRRGTNMVFVDGRAEFVSWNDFYELQWYPTFEKREVKAPF